MKKYLIKGTTMKGWFKDDRDKKVDVIKCEFYASSKAKAKEMLELIRENYSDIDLPPREYSISEIDE